MSAGNGHRWALWLGFGLWLWSAGPLQAKGFCISKGSCTTKPWTQSEVLFYTGFLAQQEGGLREGSMVVGASSRMPLVLAGGELKLVAECDIVSNTRIPEVTSYVGGLGLRAGLRLDRWAFALGLRVAVISPGAYIRPWSWGRYDLTSYYPSFRLHWRPGVWAFTLSIFDSPETSIGRVAIEFGTIGIAYSIPYGGEVFGRIEIGPETVIQIRAFAGWFLQQFSAGLKVGMVFGKGAVYRY